MNRNHIVLLITTMLIYSILVAMAGQRISLIAQEDLNLYDKPINGQVIGKIHQNEKVSVISCEDIKHYIVPVVNFAGKDAYVLEGKFHLERNRSWDFGAGSLSFSCP